MATKRRSKSSPAINVEAASLARLDSAAEGDFLVDLSAEEIERLTRAASRIFDFIAEAWKLNEEQRRSLMEPGMEAAVEGLRRVSLLMQIYTYLHTLLPASADGWVHRPNSNPLFGGRTAFNLFASDGIHGMALVRDHLAAWSEGQ